MTRPSSGYLETLAWLYGTQRFGIKLGLENMHRLLRELAVPEKEQRIVHVAGTNGKGSVCSMMASICRAQGYRIGLFTSPHLVTYRERIQVNGEMIAYEKVAEGLTLIRKQAGDWDPHPTFFEITTALALVHFRECACEVIVLETGLGGRLDATNSVDPIVSVITPIGYDHQAWLGHSLDEIAREKAGIIKAGIPVVSSVQDAAAEQVLRARAAQCGAPIEFVTEPYTKSQLALAGEHQKQNAALAIAALRFGGITVDQDSIVRGLTELHWPARFQSWDDRIIIDGAHNPDGTRVLVRTWREQFGKARATVILSILSDKDVRGICEILAPIADYVLLPRTRSQRATDPAAMSQILSTIAPHLQHSTTPSLTQAFELARTRPNPILVTGSLHFAGEALATLGGEPAALEECAQ